MALRTDAALVDAEKSPAAVKCTFPGCGAADTWVPSISSRTASRSACSIPRRFMRRTLDHNAPARDVIEKMHTPRAGAPGGRQGKAPAASGPRADQG